MCHFGKFFCKKAEIMSQDAKEPLANCRQRGIYLTFGDACVIISDCKAILRHQMCPKRLPEEHQTNVPFVRRRQLWRVGPSTRGATAPQGAQQVNFVVGSEA